MADDALIDWLASGSVVLPEAEVTARRRAEFSRRFFEAANPSGDLGQTEEEHLAAVARNVVAVHEELNALGDEEYREVWWTLSPSVRAAIKGYIEAVKMGLTP